MTETTNQSLIKNQSTQSKERHESNNIDKLITNLNNKYKIIGWKVDLQEDFMNDGSRNNYKGKLAINKALEIAPTINKIENILKHYNIPLFGSMDWHKKDSEEFIKENEDPKGKFPEHCLMNSYGAQFIEEAKLQNPFYVNWNEKYTIDELLTTIREHEGEVIFRKDAFDVYNPKGNQYTTELMKQLNVKNVFVYGVALEVCNDYAIKGHIKQGMNVFAITDGMKAINESIRDVVLESWEEMGVNLITSDQIPQTVDMIKKYF